MIPWISPSWWRHRRLLKAICAIHPAELPLIYRVVHKSPARAAFWAEIRRLGEKEAQERDAALLAWLEKRRVELEERAPWEAWGDARLWRLSEVDLVIARVVAGPGRTVDEIFSPEPASGEEE